jgi:hypothetical protein
MTACVYNSFLVVDAYSNMFLFRTTGLSLLDCDLLAQNDYSVCTALCCVRKVLVLTSQDNDFQTKLSQAECKNCGNTVTDTLY